MATEKAKRLVRRAKVRKVGKAAPDVKQLVPEGITIARAAVKLRKGGQAAQKFAATKLVSTVRQLAGASHDALITSLALMYTMVEAPTPAGLAGILARMGLPSKPKKPFLTLINHFYPPPDGLSRKRTQSRYSVYSLALQECLDRGVASEDIEVELRARGGLEALANRARRRRKAAKSSGSARPKGATVASQVDVKLTKPRVRTQPPPIKAGERESLAGCLIFKVSASNKSAIVHPRSKLAFLLVETEGTSPYKVIEHIDLTKTSEVDRETWLAPLRAAGTRVEVRDKVRRAKGTGAR